MPKRSELLLMEKRRTGLVVQSPGTGRVRTVRLNCISEDTKSFWKTTC